MTHLPNAARAILDIRKIEDYCLNTGHPRGRHKARVLQQALGLDRSHANWFRSYILLAVREADAAQISLDAFGERWRIDISVSRQDFSSVIRTLWIIRAGEEVPRFVTCWVL